MAGNLDIKNAYVFYHGMATWGNSYVTSDSAAYKLGSYDCYYIVESSQFYGDTVIKTLGASDGLWAGAVNSALQGAVTVDRFVGSTLSVDFDSTSYPNNLTLNGSPTLTRLTEGESIKNDSSVTGDTVKDALETLDSTKYEETNEIKIKVYSQDDEPTLSEDQKMAIWIDTNDSNRVYLVFRRGSGDQVSTELA